MIDVFSYMCEYTILKPVSHLKNEKKEEGNTGEDVPNQGTLYTYGKCCDQKTLLNL
jgi:hypothetical protein